MQPEVIQSMHEQVRAIYRAFTGEEVVEGSANPDATPESDETITQRFAELQVIARAFPAVMERVPPFLFAPAVDVIATDSAVVVEVALPGVERDAITIERLPEAITISGVRRGRHPAGELFHAEIPRGPFFQSIPMPFAVAAEPRIELEGGVLRIYVTLVDSIKRSKERGNNTGEEGNDEDGDERRAAP